MTHGVRGRDGVTRTASANGASARGLAVALVAWRVGGRFVEGA
jgi:hypothetical protein